MSRKLIDDFPYTDTGYPIMEKERIFISNDFSLDMIANELDMIAKKSATDMLTIYVSEINGRRAADYLSDEEAVINAVGHGPTDTVIRALMADYGVSLSKGEERNISLKEGDVLIVAQWMGGRLEEGQVITDLQVIKKNLKFFRFYL